MKGAFPQMTSTVPRVKQHKRKENNSLKWIGYIAIFLVGLFIVNNPFEAIFAEKNYEEIAEIMANFMVAEYERQKAQMQEGEEVDLKEIVKLAKRLDKTHSLTVTYSDYEFDKSAHIFLELDGGRIIKYQAISFE
jgi:hypothetical protein